jgi:hypothetical protein
VLVNVPRGVLGPFWPAYAFANATESLPAMLRPPRHDVCVDVVYDRSFMGDRWPTIGRHADREEIRRLVSDRGTIAYEFDPVPPRLLRLR